MVFAWVPGHCLKFWFPPTRWDGWAPKNFPPLTAKGALWAEQPLMPQLELVPTLVGILFFLRGRNGRFRHFGYHRPPFFLKHRPLVWPSSWSVKKYNGRKKNNQITTPEKLTWQHWKITICHRKYITSSFVVDFPASHLSCFCCWGGDKIKPRLPFS